MLLFKDIVFCELSFVVWSVFTVMMCRVEASGVVIVDSPFGKIQGLEKTDDVTGLTYVYFRGIPYAKPPVGPLRFEKPQPHPNIDGIFDATKDGPIICPHPDSLSFGFTHFTEDCLVLNIQARSIDQSNPLRKVIVYIHGGAFHFGVGVMHDARSFIANHDIIVVTINYRLGVLGFLSTENDAAPGNFGLWDQTLAIKWVKHNIRAFGGDPDDISLIGESAGGTSVGYQSISTHTKGLFTKAFSMSGSATSVYSQAVDAQSHALTFARTFGCWNGQDVDSKIGVGESRTVIDCLRNLPLSNFTSYVSYDITKTQFVPRIDGDFVVDAPGVLLQDDVYLDSVGFFDRTYMASLVNNEVGIGYNLNTFAKTESFSDLRMSLEEKQAAYERLVSNFEKMYLRIRSHGEASENNIKQMMDAVNVFYGSRYADDEVFGEFMIDLDSIIPPFDFLAAASRRKSSNSYFLYFNHFPRFISGPIKGLPHEADLAFWFEFDLDFVEAYVQAGIQKDLFDDDDRHVKRMFSSIVAEFATSGNPGLALKDKLPFGWPKYDVSKAYFLNFNLHPWIDQFPKKEKQQFWMDTIPSLVTPDLPLMVDSPFGKIQGLEKTDDVTGLTYVSFRGIPYAKPPVGPLRFEKPQPHPNIDGVFDASKDIRVVCPQPNLATSFNETNMQEDCLVLNVQLKDLDPSKELRKVVVFLHGGHFRVGSGSFYDSKSFVISQDVIVVTINYRLGVLGFLSTENDAAPGNFGLWDQTLAIKWVKDNIRAFGGDPDDIAIAGESSGGISTGYQAISPHAKGLFSKAYQHSGMATSVFGRSINPQFHALELAKSLSCWGNDVTTKVSAEESKLIVDCLRKVPLSAIASFDVFSVSETKFAPSLDGDFIPNVPAKLLQDDTYLESIGFFDRSYLIAINNDNGAGVKKNALKVTSLPLNKNNNSPRNETEPTEQSLLQSRFGDSCATKRNIRSEIDDLYSRVFQDVKVTMEMTTDLNVVVSSFDVLRAATKRTSCSPYFLYFDHFPQFLKGQYKGSPVSLDLLYWFDFDLKDMEQSMEADVGDGFPDKDRKLKRMFSSIVGDFVKTGNPGVSLKGLATPTCWPKYDATNSQYLNFNPTPFVSRFLEKDKQDLWLNAVPGLMKNSNDSSC